MKKLEIVLHYDRISLKAEALRKVWPRLERVANSEFYHIFFCEVEGLSIEEKKWLEELVKNKDIINFCCKDRGRNFVNRPRRGEGK